MQTKRVAGSAQLIVLVVIALVLAAVIVVLDRYNAGSKDMLTVETRGMQMITALSKYRQENGAYPDSLEKLVPQFAPAVGNCPSGASMEYRAAAGEYELRCENVVFKVQPYRYNSRTRSWDS
jgi:type II secretory pathway pseudopilin PulG